MSHKMRKEGNVFFFFKQKTAYEITRRDWSSDVCSSDLGERHGRVLELVNEIGREKYRRDIGKRVQVLVEGPSRKNPARLEGRTRTNKIVVFEGSERH